MPVLTRNEAEDKMVEYLRALEIVNMAQIDGRARLLIDLQQKEEEKRRIAEVQKLTPEQEKILSLPIEQQNALAEKRAFNRLQSRLADPTISANLALAEAEVEKVNSTPEVVGVSSPATVIKGV